MGEFMPVMLVNLAGCAARDRTSISAAYWLDKLTQLLRHGFAFNHKMADKSGAVGGFQASAIRALGVIFRPDLAVKLIGNSRLRFKSLIKRAGYRHSHLTLQHDFRERNSPSRICAAIFAIALQKWLLANAGLGV